MRVLPRRRFPAAPSPLLSTPVDHRNSAQVLGDALYTAINMHTKLSLCSLRAALLICVGSSACSFAVIVRRHCDQASLDPVKIICRAVPHQHCVLYCCIHSLLDVYKQHAFFFLVPASSFFIFILHPRVLFYCWLRHEPHPGLIGSSICAPRLAAQLYTGAGG